MRKALLVLVMVGGLSLVLWSGYRNLRERTKPVAQQPAAVIVPDTPASLTEDSPMRGKPAPAFTLVDVDGRKVSLSDFKGHPLVVNFWGTYCAPCKIEMPWLEEFSNKYAADGFDVIGVTYDAEVGKDTITRNTRKLGVTYPILLSNPGIEKAYLSGTEVLPMSFYVDRTGTIIAVTAGLGEKDQLEAMVRKTIAAGAN